MEYCYCFSFSIPKGYEVSDVTSSLILNYSGTITVNLTGPPIFEIFDSQKVVDEPADFLSIDIFWFGLEGDFVFEESVSSVVILW